MFRSRPAAVCSLLCSDECCRVLPFNTALFKDVSPLRGARRGPPAGRCRGRCAIWRRQHAAGECLRLIGADPLNLSSTFLQRHQPRHCAVRLSTLRGRASTQHHFASCALDTRNPLQKDSPGCGSPICCCCWPWRPRLCRVSAPCILHAMAVIKRVAPAPPRSFASRRRHRAHRQPPRCRPALVGQPVATRFPASPPPSTRGPPPSPLTAPRHPGSPAAHSIPGSSCGTVTPEDRYDCCTTKADHEVDDDYCKQAYPEVESPNLPPLPSTGLHAAVV